MKNVLFRRGISAVCAGILCASSASAWGKSAKEVFAEVARSVVVVLALDSNGETSAQGSGVVVGKNEVATNCHVIEDAAKIAWSAKRCEFDSGQRKSYRMSAEILTRDDERDLCLLFIGRTLRTLPPRRLRRWVHGERADRWARMIYAVGAPEGFGVVIVARGGFAVAEIERQEKFSAPFDSNRCSHLTGIVGRGTCLMMKGEFW